MWTKLKQALAAMGAISLAACATPDPVTGSVDRHFGEALAWNKAVQVINPDPVHSPTGAQPGSSGGAKVNSPRGFTKPSPACRWSSSSPKASLTYFAYFAITS